MRGAFVLAGLMIALTPWPLYATVGGEELIDVWGWDSVRQGVVIQLHRQNGSDAFNPVLLLRPGLPDSTIHVQDCVYREDELASESACAAVLRGLRATLQPFTRVTSPRLRFPFSMRVVVADSVLRYGDLHPRFVVEARFDWTVLYRVTTYFRTDVSMVDRYHLPGQDLDLVVLAFFGTGFEGGYETWVPVFVPRRSDPPYTRERSTVVEVQWGPGW